MKPCIPSQQQIEILAMSSFNDEQLSEVYQKVQTLATNANVDLDAAVNYLALTSPLDATSLPSPRTLLILGADDIHVPQMAADLFVDTLFGLGCRRVIISGGIGRSTPKAYLSVLRDLPPSVTVERVTTSQEAQAPKGCVAWLTFGHLERLGMVARKPMFSGAIDIGATAEEVSHWATEADIFLEIFVARVTKRIGASGVKFVMAVDKNNQPRSAESKRQDDESTVELILENGSTNTGNNITYTKDILFNAGIVTEASARQFAEQTVVVNQFALHRRSLATLAKHFGGWPMGRAPRPDFINSEEHQRAVLVGRAAGEYTRIPAYARPDKAFCLMPSDFPHKIGDFFASIPADLQSELVTASALGLDVNGVEIDAILSKL